MGLVTHRLFSYGTLRQADVQQTLYGRRAATTPDVLPGFRLDWVQITDTDVIATSGSDRHPILRPGTANDAVEGACLELNDDELARSDDYEADDYTRISVTLGSGVTAWVYAGADSDPGPS